MKILHVIPNLHTGGGEKICIELCNELARDKNNEVTLCSLKPLSEDQQIMYNKISKDVNFFTLDKKGKSLSIFFKTIKLIKSVNPDVVHTHLRAIHFSALGIILTGKPNVHTLPTLADKEAPGIIIKLYKVLYKYFNFDPVSMGVRVFNSCKKVYGDKCKSNIDIGTIPLEKTEKFDEVKSTIDGYRKDENTKVFVSIGRLYNVKNQLLLIESFMKLLEEGYYAHRVIKGSNNFVAEYGKKCEKLVAGNERIHIVGEKSNVSDYLLNADALCFSSIYEGLPMSIVEAMSIGLPTISTPVGGIPDLIEEGVNGYLSPDMSSDNYKELFKKIIEGEKLNSEKIKDIYNEQYSIEMCAKKYLEVYKSKVANG
jgi:glycosyltransferase involved in cell wall biosynthesis